MKKSEFSFPLPEELIAQTPATPRDSSRLLLIDREKKQVNHKRFYDITEYLRKGDVLVLNDAKVLPARIFANRETGGKTECLLLSQEEKDIWKVLLKPAKRVKVGEKLRFADGELVGEVIDIYETGERKIKFVYSGNFYTILEKIGEMPLPHYIKTTLEEQNRYQTVYAAGVPASAAAPTAGLHFTEELLEKIRDMGVEICYLTLHVGLGTFRPVQTDDIKDHFMHSESFEIGEETAKIINKAKLEGRRVIAAGTTACRSLEAADFADGQIIPCQKSTNIFIYPGYKFHLVDALITNFHLPESTLIMLVCAFAGQDFIMETYKKAVEEKYRFFSFGDAMFIY